MEIRANGLIKGLVLGLFGLLAGCGTGGWLTDEKLGLDLNQGVPMPAEEPLEGEPEAAAAARTARQRPGTPPADARGSELYPGTGVFINPQAVATPPAGTPAEGGITLNFEAADIREVVAFMLGDILKVNYLIDPKVQGTVTLQTSRPVDPDAVLSILENVLRMNGAALVREPNLYRIVPTAAAAQSSVPAMAAPLPGFGFRTMVVQLRYIGAEQMKKLLEPTVPGNGVLRADADRNLLILGGTTAEVNNMLDMIGLFDVDWLRGMSVGLVPVEYTDTEAIAKDLGAIVGDDSSGPLAGMLRIVPIERLKSLLVITPQPRYLKEARRWIERLDRPSDGEGRRLFVYRVQNGRAEELASILNDLFAPEKIRKQVQVTHEVAPGYRPASLRSRTMADVRTHPPGAATGAGAIAAAPTAAAGGPVPVARTTAEKSIEGLAAEVGDIRIMADKSKNALVILATPSDYGKIEAAIHQLDTVPLQVLVEVAIYDVILSGDLAYGIQWFFNNALGDGEGRGVVGAPLAFSSTFSYTFLSATGDIRALIRLLASEDKVRVISTPSLMVLDNQSATIRVGDQVPINTDTFSSTGDLISTSVSFKDTGVTLRVTPRVNAGGLVSMDISQEVTNIGEIDEATGERTFFQRSIQSTVAIQSGETVVLGGLISHRSAQARSGVPVLYKLPVVGNLFGQTVNETTRNELVVMITPRAVRNRGEARLVTREFRRRLDQMDPFRNKDEEQPQKTPREATPLPPPAKAATRPGNG